MNSYQEHIQRLEQSNNLLLKQVANKDKQIEFMAQEDLSSLSKEISQLPESALKNRLLALARKVSRVVRRGCGANQPSEQDLDCRL